MGAFFEFNQNNSGGSFDFDKRAGITHYVIIEADSLSDAIKKAENIGLYFEGCEKGIDCSCCGDRWYEPYKDEGTKTPSIYGKTITKKTVATLHKWMKPGHEVCVHYLDGRKEWF